jgi:hypothetical protein
VHDLPYEEYPAVTFTSRCLTSMRRDEIPVIFTQIGQVAFWSHNGVPIRLIHETATTRTLDLVTPQAGKYFGSTGKRVTLAELKFHMLRLLGEESLRIIDPYVDKLLGVK